LFGLNALPFEVNGKIGVLLGYFLTIEPKENVKQEATRLKDLGNDEFKKRNFKSAIEYYTKAISLDEQNHVLYSNRSLSFWNLKRFDDALNDANKSLALNPTWTKAKSRTSSMFSDFIQRDCSTKRKLSMGYKSIKNQGAVFQTYFLILISFEGIYC
jgi:tetratricopeptide (TPR) repeat protein